MKSMNAAVLEGHQKWQYREVPYPECGDGEVLVQIQAAGICSSDVLRSMNTGFYFYPIIPGHEFCGTVAELGNDVDGITVGDRVAVYPLIPCKKCSSCLKGHYNRCDDYSFLGSRTDGGYADFVTCPSENVVRIPDNVTFEHAALCEPYSVTLHAAKRAMKFDGVETVAVMGLGPLGQMLAQWAKVFGVDSVYGFCRDETRYRIGEEVGFKEVIDTRRQEPKDAIHELTDGEGVDLIFECSGTNVLQTQALESVAKGGQIVCVGNPTHSLKIDKPVYDKILRRELTITGSWSSLIHGVNEWKESLDYLSAGAVSPEPIITHRVPLKDAGSVIEDMYLKRFEFCKIVIDINGG